MLLSLNKNRRLIRLCLSILLLLVTTQTMALGINTHHHVIDSNCAVYSQCDIQTDHIKTEKAHLNHTHCNGLCLNFLYSDALPSHHILPLSYTSLPYTQAALADGYSKPGYRPPICI